MGGGVSWQDTAHSGGELGWRFENVPRDGGTAGVRQIELEHGAHSHKLVRERIPMLWTKIESLIGCTRLTGACLGLFELAIPDGTHWLIGPYARLTVLATALRTQESLRDTLGALRIRLGLRATDIAPTGDRQPRYGSTIQGRQHAHDFTTIRNVSLAKPALPLAPGQAAPVNRRSDREENVRTFWMTQTPQSHHIVEFNNLRDIKASEKGGTSEMDYDRLPAVLLAAEFHQRYISAFLKDSHGKKPDVLRKEMPGMYRTLYLDRSPLCSPLWDVSKVILREAGLAV